MTPIFKSFLVRARLQARAGRPCHEWRADDTGVSPVHAVVFTLQCWFIAVLIVITGVISLPAQTLPTEPATVPATLPATLPVVSSTIGPAIIPATVPSTIPATAPATNPTTEPARVPIRPEILPTDYAVLTSRSIFMKGRVPTPVIISTDPFASAPTTAPARSREDSIVFNGVTEADGSIVAFLEDTSAGKVTIYRAGDAIALGKIVSITLDGLDYQAGDKTVHVLIGQTLSGGEALPVNSRPSTSGSPGGSTGGPMDILEKLRQKRLRELGQGR